MAGGDKQSGDGNEFVHWHAVASSASEFVVAVGLGAAAGYGLDLLIGTAPWLLISGVGVGFAIGLYMLIRIANKTFKD